MTLSHSPKNLNLPPQTTPSSPLNRRLIVSLQQHPLESWMALHAHALQQTAAQRQLWERMLESGRLWSERGMRRAAWRSLMLEYCLKPA